MQRRTLLASIGGSIATGAAIGTTFTGTTKGTQADTSLGSLSIPDKEALTNGNAVTDVTLEAQVAFEWSGNKTPTGHELILRVGHDEYDLYPIAQTRVDEELPQSGSGETTLSGSVLGTPAFSYSSFSVENEGEEKKSSLFAELEFTVFGPTSELATASVMDSAVITVRNEAIQVDARVGGEGVVVVETT